jgi:hypothetical protein
MASKIIYWTADGGGGDGIGPVATELHWIVQQDTPADHLRRRCLFIGDDSEFAVLDQMGGDVSRMCGRPAIDWAIRSRGLARARYRQATKTFGLPPIAAADRHGETSGRSLRTFPTSRLAAHLPRHRTVQGAVPGDRKWPFTEHSQIAWLTGALGGQCQGRIFSRTGRLSWGSHEDNPGLDDLWRLLFDAAKPLVSLRFPVTTTTSAFTARDQDLAQLSEDGFRSS